MTERPVPAVSILAVVDELRRKKELVQFVDPSGTYWMATSDTGIGFCDTILRAAWKRELLSGGEDPKPGERRRVTLKPALEIAPIVSALERKHEAVQQAAADAGAFVTDDRGNTVRPRRSA